MADTIMNTYGRLPVTFESGEGCRLTDTAGKTYLDAISGIAVCGLGHAHPAVAEAICAQSRRLIHTSNLYQVKLQQELADKLTSVAGMDKVFFGNSGAEANEAAIKLARLYGNKKGIKDPTVIVTTGSFHGRTLATLSATGNRKVQAGFEPLVQGFARVTYNEMDGIRNIAKNNKNVVAILVEPIQGEGGINIPNENYLNNIREICDENGWLMMLDEIQTGMGRTGKWFAYQHSDIKPDVITLAKALGNGVPIGACLARGAAADVFQPGNHGSTFGGNPLACAAALAVLNTIEKQKLVDAAAKLGDSLLSTFKANLADLEGIVEIRGKGLMIGIELDRPCAAIVGKAMEKGLLVNVTAEKSIRLLPPLVMSHDEATELTDTLSEIITQFLAESQG